MAEHGQLYGGMEAARAAARYADTAVETAAAEVEARANDLAVHQAAQALVQAVAAQVQGEVTEALGNLVSKCLAAVFGPGAYRLNIQMATKRGRTEVVLHLQDPVTGELLDPLTATGGGVVDIAAFALRVAAVLLHRPAARRLLVLDEPFKFLSSGHRLAARDLLVTLAAELGFQFVLVTHLPELMLPGSITLGPPEAVPE